MEHDLVVLADAEAVAIWAAAWLADAIRTAVARQGRGDLALSGGRTPWSMLGHLRAHVVPWDGVTVHQVDERVAPHGDPARNLTHLAARLDGLPVHLSPMPVEDADLERAAAAYGTGLPDPFDVVHLGLGADGHTASLVPGDAVLDVDDRLVAVSGEYQGHRRMTLTYPALARADRLLWLVAGGDKADALARLLACDPAIPAGRVRARASLVVADAAAARRPPS